MTIELPVKVKVAGVPEAKQALMGLGKIAAEIFAVGKMLQFAKAGVAKWAEVQAATNGLTAALGKQSKELENLAKVSSKIATFHDEDIMQGYKRLALYGLTEAQIKKISPVMMDLAAVTGDVSGAARMLGQGIELGTGKLKTYGIVVDKTASVNDRFNSVLKQGEAALAGQSAAAFAAMDPFTKMSRVIEEASIGIGDALVPDLNSIANNLPELAGALEGITKGALTIFKTAVFTVDLAVAGAIDILTVFAHTILALPRLIPGVKKFTDPAIGFFDTMAQAANENVKNIIYNTAKMWDEGAKEAEKGASKIAKLKIKEDAEEEARDNAAKKKELERQKKLQEDKKTLIEKLEHDASQIRLSEGEKKMADLGIQYEKDEAMLKGNLEALANLRSVYTDQMQALADEEVAIAKEKSDKEKKIDEKAEASKLKALDKLNSLEDTKGDKNYKSKLEKLKKTYNTDKKLLEDNGLSTVELTRQFEDSKGELKQQAMEQGLSAVVDNLGKLASKHKEFVGLYKVTAGAQALIDTYKSAQSAYASLAGIPIIGPALGVAASIAAVTAGLANVQQIASAKMAAGGVVKGGIPGKDSVPAMLTPGEIVYNPAQPNPALASMITNTDNSNTSSHSYHISMPITVQGNPTNTTIARIGEVSEKALIRALKRAQNMGKVSATGLTVRA